MYGPFGHLSSFTSIGQNWPTSHVSYFALSTAIACLRVAVYPATAIRREPSGDRRELVLMEEASALLLSVWVGRVTVSVV